MERPSMTVPEMLQRANQYVTVEALVIEDLIRRGHLDRFVRKLCELSLHPKGSVERQIDVIVGGLAASGDSSSTRKAYARAEVQKRPQARCDPEITFESNGEYPDHDDALVITAHIANTHVKRIMIDTELHQHTLP
ncbi:hypothetical protein B296_00041377 [Ensete ventricosum]|uniref:Uncharacterized protein n=1 Tax=Ensete ventricosum TaxID=4639 RepID=A0A426Z9F9_ENSVE|nr:hypothetical protein B296_00041377 [Ensete ventricosum]